MNDSPKNETDTIRSNIDVTRRRMDDTMDALGDRLQPRHLLDEVLGFLRGNSDGGESRMSRLGERVSHSCSSAMHSVADSVKQNPMPALLIGAGVAWMIYSSRRDDSDRYEFDDYSAEDAKRRYDPDVHYDRPLDYPAAPGSAGEAENWSRQAGGKMENVKNKLVNKASSAAENLKEKVSNAGEAAREKMETIKGKAEDMTARVRESTRRTYARTRERVVETADHHPLEVGLVALAAGLVAGLALPTPNAINRRLGPTADRLRERTREAGEEMLEKGKRVAEAAVEAVKDEADAQGLTPERLREKAGAVANRATEAGKQAADREGLTPGSEGSSENDTSGSNPSEARPVA